MLGVGGVGAACMYRGATRRWSKLPALYQIMYMYCTYIHSSYIHAPYKDQMKAGKQVHPEGLAGVSLCFKQPLDGCVL